ncbi:MAG: M24 family metallopeptidase [Rhodospirillaceae bacterium]|nr:M24 family metallopeptidase [Rhodospirillaceae bacterium]MBT6119060.1 M24 family metallopeptidase [Rhodospirillaceae bacterium]
MSVFERDEYMARVSKTKASMAEKGIDVLIVTDPANMNYLSGYDGWSFYVHQCLVVAQDHDEPVWIGRAQDANGAYVTAFLDHANVVGYPDHYVQSTERHPMDFVADFLKQRGWDKGTVGSEQDNYYYTAACQASLEKGLPNASFVDTTALVNWVRVVKSEREIGYMRDAARIMEKVMRLAVNRIEPGMKQSALAAEIFRAEVVGTDGYGGGYPGILPPLMPTGDASNAPHLTWTDKEFVAGEGTIYELGTTRHQYHCPMARTVYLGKAPTVVSDTAKVVVEGLNAALDFAKPGVTAEQIEEAWRGVISKHGLEKESRIGYSIGVNYPPDWGEHTISLRPKDKTVMQPGMTMHCIPSLWIQNWGIEISESFRITETGSEVFCDFPRQLFEKD